MEEPYVLRKNGMYYAHNNCGYVSRVLLAELYTKEYAQGYVRGHDDIRAIPISECLTGSAEVEEYIERLKVMRDFMKHTETRQPSQLSTQKECSYPDCCCSIDKPGPGKCWRGLEDKVPTPTQKGG